MYTQRQALPLLSQQKRAEHPFLNTVDDHTQSHLGAAAIGGSGAPVELPMS